MGMNHDKLVDAEIKSNRPKKLARPETKKNSAKPEKKNPLFFTPAETDTLIAALRMWQRIPAYPELDLASEHGEPISDAEIDDMIERINCA